MNNEFDKNRDCTKEYTTFPIAVLLLNRLYQLIIINIIYLKFQFKDRLDKYPEMESKLFILSNGVSTVADLYIAAMCLSKLNVLNSWELYVYCPLCNYLATLKPAKTRKLMVRCNTCSILIFAN
jgi:hypothetical protein